MKRKKIQIDESVLMSRTEESQIRGGKERTRWRAADGSKLKVITN
jgi:hypothetical protein